MTQPPEGRIYWSARARRFYQEGRAGAVSHFNAIPTLTLREGEATWRDQSGRFVERRAVLEAQPFTIRFTGRDAQGRPFLATEFVDRPVGQSEIAGRQLASNQQVVVRTVIVTPDGVTHVSTTSSLKGTRVDLDFLNDQANKKAADELMTKGYPIRTNDVGTYTKARTYAVRDINILNAR